MTLAAGGSAVVDSLLIVTPIWDSVIVLCFVVRYFVSKIVSEYDQEIPQSQTADNPVAP